MPVGPAGEGRIGSSWERRWCPAGKVTSAIPDVPKEYRAESLIAGCRESRGALEFFDLQFEQIDVGADFPENLGRPPTSARLCPAPRHGR